MITFLSLLLLRFNFSCFCIFPSAFFIATMALAVVDRVRVYQCHYCCNNVTVDGTACQFSGDYKGVARPCEMEEVLWWKGNMCIGSGNNCCSTCFAGCGETFKKRQHNRATNEFWKRKPQICAGCTAAQGCVGSEAVIQWHAAAVVEDPAVPHWHVPPGLRAPQPPAPQPPAPPPPPVRVPSVESISDVMKAVQSQVARLEARVEEGDEAMQCLELHVRKLEAAIDDKDEYLREMETRLKKMELQGEAVGHGAKTNEHEETDQLPWSLIGKHSLVEEACERMPHDMGRMTNSKDIRYDISG